MTRTRPIIGSAHRLPVPLAALGFEVPVAQRDLPAAAPQRGGQVFRHGDGAVAPAGAPSATVR